MMGNITLMTYSDCAAVLVYACHLLYLLLLSYSNSCDQQDAAFAHLQSSLVMAACIAAGNSDCSLALLVMSHYNIIMQCMHHCS
jgi:hypothetical protein